MEIHSYQPIYQKVFEFYKKRILAQEYLPNQKIDSISRIMSRHNVSRETAKKVIKILIDKKLVISRAGKGTFVCPRHETVNIWGMVIPITSSNTEQLINKIHKRAQELNRELQFFFHYNNPEEETRLVQKMIFEGYEAIIIVPNYDETLTAEFYKNLIPGNTQIVLADNTMAGSFFQYVIQSYDLGVKRAFEHLSKTPEGNYLLLGNERWMGKNLVFDLMEQTFGELISRYQPERKLYTVQSISEIDREFIKENRVVGILSLQDSNTVRMLRRLINWEYKIPQDLKLVAYGNTELIETNTPAITAIRCHYEMMSQEIVKMIMQKDKKDNKQVILQPALIVRET